MISFGQEIKWTNRDGTKHKVYAGGAETLDEARQIAFENARSMGWTPPKWWQWWRWNDTRIS